MTESQIIERAGEGDPGAMRQLYDRHSARVFSIVRRIAGDDELARDCAQEAWIRVMRGLPSFRGEARFSTWLHRVAVNVALQGTRKRERRRAHETEIDGHTPTERCGEPGDVLLRQRLDEALDRLSPGMRGVLVLHDIEGYTHEAIAELMEIAPGTSKSQLFRARARMREILSPSIRPDRAIDTQRIQEVEA